MESPGAKLKRIRLEKGLSLEEVHKKTKIHLDILKSIEEDSLVNFSPVYIKGFLKIYGNFLGVDISEFVFVPRADTIVKKAPQEKLGAFSLFKLHSFNLSAIKPKINIKIMSLVILGLVLLIGIFYLGKGISSLRASRAQAAKRSVLLTEKKVDKKTTVLKTQIKLPLKAKPKNQDIKNPAKKIFTSGVRLTIHAKEDCWVQLKADGKLIGRNVLKKGKTETWQAKEKIEFSLNNAGAVDLEVNNKSIPSLGRRNQAIKNALVNKEGLIDIRR
ncbi:helix-turn-helix domain-containing protein [bacterium]|nr:MAG: helix-turn-helix domain-containing protein [bacterium]